MDVVEWTGSGRDTPGRKKYNDYNFDPVVPNCTGFGTSKRRETRPRPTQVSQVSGEKDPRLCTSYTAVIPDKMYRTLTQLAHRSSTKLELQTRNPSLPLTVDLYA